MDWRRRPPTINAILQHAAAAVAAPDEIYLSFFLSIIKLIKHYF